jgi:hypothetical protein
MIALLLLIVYVLVPKKSMKITIHAKVAMRNAKHALVSINAIHVKMGIL